MFQQGFGLGLQRELAAPATGSSDIRMATLGRLLAGLCLPEASGATLQALINGLALGQRLELAIESADPALLGLPFEALRLPDGRLLATQPGVVMWRRPAGLAAPAQPPLAGPLKLLAPLRPLGRPLPLVLLNACHGGVAAPVPVPAAPAAHRANPPSPRPGLHNENRWRHSAPCCAPAASRSRPRGRS